MKSRKQKSATSSSSHSSSKENISLSLGSFLSSQTPRDEESKLSLNSLPPEVLFEILMKLPPEDLKLAILTNRKFHAVLQDDVLWKSKCQLHFPHIYKAIQEPDKVDNWFKMFWTIYKNEYAALEKPVRRFFSLVKEGNIAALAHPEKGHNQSFIKFKKLENRFIQLSDLSQKDKSGYTLIDYARFRNNQQMLDYFYHSFILPYYSDKSHIDIEKLDEKKYGILHWAIELNQHNIESLVAQAMKNNSILTPDIRGRTPFHIAAQVGNLAAIKHLIEKGIDANLLARDLTALWIAAAEGHLPVVEYLIANGANIHTPNKNNITALWMAAQNGHFEVVEYLIANGANIHTPNQNNSTPLYIAAQNGHFAIVEHLIAKGAGINAPRRDNATPLNIAAQAGHFEIVKHLIEKGAKVNTPAIDGCTPLWAAAQKGHFAIVEHLIINGADINKSAEDNTTPLFIAAQNGHLEIVKLLIGCGADINIALKRPKGDLDAFVKHIGENPDAQQRLSKFIAEETKKKTGYNPIKIWQASDVEITITPLQIAEIMGHKEVVNYIKGCMAKTFRK